jgi:hypothetical protein
MSELGPVRNFGIEDLTIIRNKCRELEAILNAIPLNTGNWLFECHVGDLLSELRQMARAIEDSLKELNSETKLQSNENA